MATANEVVRPRWSHLEYKWRLDNLWELRALACVEALEDEGGGLIWSEKFGDKDRGYWQLKLYPYGDASPAGRGHVSLFLSLDLKSIEVSKAYAIFGCYLLDERGEKVAGSGRSFTRQKFAEGSSSWGWSQFIKVEGQSLNRVLCPPSDSLVIRCDIDVFVGVSSAPARNLPAPNSLFEDVKDLIADSEYHDVPIYLSDGTVMSGNRLVLISRSQYFARQLLGQRKRVPPFQGSENASSMVCEAKCTLASPVRATSPTPGLGDLEKENIMPESTRFRPPEVLEDMMSSYTSFGGPIDIATTNAWQQTVDKFSGPTTSADYPSRNHGVSAGIARTMVKQQEVIEIVDNVPVEAMKNLLKYMHTDDCPYMNVATPLRKVLELFVLAKQFEVESLYRALMRSLCASLVSKSTALAIQEVARRLEVEELEDECRNFLLTCVRDLSDQDLIRAIIPKPSS